MKTKKVMSAVFIGLAFLLVVSTTRAQAQQCCYFNPLLLPFAVAGAVIGTAAAITTGVVAAPAYPAYYGPAYYGPRPGYYYGPGPYYHSYHRHHTWTHRHHHRYGGGGPNHRRGY